MLTPDMTKGIYDDPIVPTTYLQIRKASQMIPLSYHGIRWLIPMDEASALDPDLIKQIDVPIVANLTNDHPEYYDLYETDANGYVGIGFGFRYKTKDAVVRAMYKTDMANILDTIQNPDVPLEDIYSRERIPIEVYRKFAEFDKPVPDRIPVGAVGVRTPTGLEGISLFYYLNALRISI